MRVLKFGLLAWLVFAAFTGVSHAQQFQADSKINVRSYVVPNNTTAVVVKANPGAVYGVTASNNGSTLAYVKLYDAAAGITCGTGTPIARFMIPASTATLNVQLTNGDAFAYGITACVTTGIADNDTSAPAATTYILNIHYK